MKSRGEQARTAISSNDECRSGPSDQPITISQILPQLYCLANNLKAQIIKLFKQPYNPDLLPVWPPPTEIKVRHKLTPNQRRAVAQRERQALNAQKPACEYYDWLRALPTRELVLSEWGKARARCKCDVDSGKSVKIGCRCIREENYAAASKILKHMFTRYYGEEVGKTIAHHTTRSRQAEPVMRDIFPRDFITVEVRHRINFVEPGTSIEIPVSEFLEEARRYALGIERAAGPPFVPTGKSPAAWMARNCWGVLEVLGNHRRRESDGDKWQSVTMETILSELDIRSSGNRSCSIRRVVGGLVSFGSVNKSQGPTGLRYRIKHRTVKRKPPRTDDKAPTKQTVT